MGRRPSIDEETGQALIEAYGRLGSKRAAAEELDIPPAIAIRYLNSLKRAAAPQLAQQAHMVETAGARLWDTQAALEENYERLIALVEQLQDGITVVNGEYTTLTPIMTQVSALREVREHLETSMTMAKLMIDIDEVRRFQQAVLEAIGAADEPTRQRIIQNLRQQRALGLLVQGNRPGG